MCHPWDGGNGDNPCFQYNDLTQTWHVGPHPINNVEDSVSVLMRNDEVWWVTGGRIGSSSSYTDQTEIIDSAKAGNLTFEAYDPLPDSAGWHNLVAINESAVFFLDGSASSGAFDKCWIYDLNSRQWNPLPDLPIAKRLPAAGYAESSDGTRKFIVVTGGDNDDRSTWMFDLYGEFWKPGIEFPNLYARISASVPFKGTTFLVVGGGGNSGGGYSDQIVEFEPDTETWIQRPETLKDEKYQVAAFMIPDDYAEC